MKIGGFQLEYRLTITQYRDQVSTWQVFCHWQNDKQVQAFMTGLYMYIKVKSELQLHAVQCSLFQTYQHYKGTDHEHSPQVNLTTNSNVINYLQQ